MTKSAVMLYIVFGIFVCQVVIVQAGGKFMSTVPLGAGEWLFSVAVGALALPVGVWSRKAAAAPGGNRRATLLLGPGGLGARLLGRLTGTMPDEDAADVKGV